MEGDRKFETPDPYLQIAETSVEKDLVMTIQGQGYAEACRSHRDLTPETLKNLNRRFKMGRLKKRLIQLPLDSTWGNGEIYLRDPSVPGV